MKPPLTMEAFTKWHEECMDESVNQTIQILDASGLFWTESQREVVMEVIASMTLATASSVGTSLGDRFDLTDIDLIADAHFAAMATPKRSKDMEGLIARLHALTDSFKSPQQPTPKPDCPAAPKRPPTPSAGPTPQ